MSEISPILARYEELKERNTARDVRMAQVAQIRANNGEAIAPGLFSTDWPKSVVANFVDMAARDLSK